MLKSIDYQRALASYCRKPEEEPPGVRSDRIEVYRRLVYQNVLTVLSKIFPLSKRLLGAEPWDALITTFIAKHKMSSHQLWRMPLEFAAFVSEGSRPFQDLLRFEALDHELRWMADEPIPLYSQHGHPLNDRLVVNPEHRLAAFCYPVFRLPASELKGNDGNYYLLLFRHSETLQVQLFELSPLYLLVFEHLREESLSGREVLELVAQHFGPFSREALFSRGEQFLRSLIEQGAVLGYRHTI